MPGAADRSALIKTSLRIGMGPFELMNVTGPPIALHAATTLGRLDYAVFVVAYFVVEMVITLGLLGVVRMASHE